MKTQDTLERILKCLEATDSENSTMEFNVNGNPMLIDEIYTKSNSDVIHLSLKPKLIKRK